MTGPECPLWVKSRHVRRKRSCPLYPRKRLQKQTSCTQIYVRLVPIADIGLLFDYFVGAREHGRRHSDTEGFGGLEIDDELVLGRRLHW